MIKKTIVVGIAYWHLITNGIKVPASLAVIGLEGNSTKGTVPRQDISGYTLECIAWA
jgi:hypothetical protein